ncbi:MAG: M23 family metallopeptidase [Pseudomonadota bacterium]
MTAWRLILAGAALLIGAPALSANACSEDWLCVEAHDQDGDYALVARNLRDLPVTVTVNARLDNLAASRALPLTRTLDPGERVELVRLERVEEERETHYRYWFDWAPGDGDARHDDGYRYRLPYAGGKRYRVLQGYGSRFSHTGKERYTVDFDMEEGTPVHAAREGVVARVQARHDRGCWEDECARYANFIVIAHADGTTGEYYHLQQHGVLVQPGERVRRGQHIGYSGNTGHTTTPHLHFGVYRPHTWGTTQSLPVVFSTADGELKAPRPGRGYVAR